MAGASGRAATYPPILINLNTSEKADGVTIQASAGGFAVPSTLWNPAKSYMTAHHPRQKDDGVNMC